MSAKDVPNEATLVRFLATGEYDTYKDAVVASVNAFRDPHLSVDWLEETTIEAGYARKPKSEAHACFRAGAARDLEQTVDHTPNDANDAHCTVHCPEGLREKGRRRHAVCHLLFLAIIATGARPRG